MPPCSDAVSSANLLRIEPRNIRSQLLPRYERLRSHNHKPTNRSQSSATKPRRCQSYIRPSTMSSSSLFRAAARVRPLSTAYRASPIIRRPLAALSNKTTRTFSTTIVRNAEASTGAASSHSDHHEESFEEFSARYASYCPRI